MAAVTYVGVQLAVAKVMTLTVTTADPTSAVTFTAGPTQSIAVKPSSSTVATAASDFAIALAAAGGAFSDMSYSASGAVVTITGPADGAPFTFAKSDAGANSTTLATTVGPKSPSDVGDPANYSTGALPVTGVDSLTVENTAVPLLYNLDALAAITLTGFTRRATHTGAAALPTTNANGYPEYRPTELSVKCTSWLVEQGDSDAAGALRFKAIDPGSPVTVTVTGSGSNAPVGSEAVELEGLPASSVVDVAGASVAVAPLSGQACTVATLKGNSATVRVGASATLSGTVELEDAQARIAASWATSLSVDGTSQVEIAGAAGGPGPTIDGGTVTWKSTGNLSSAPTVGGGGTLDFALAPAAVTITGTIQLYAGAALLDPYGRAGNWAAKLNRCVLSEVTISSPGNKTITLS